MLSNMIEVSQKERIKMNVIVVPKSVDTNVYSGERNVLYHTTFQNARRDEEIEQTVFLLLLFFFFYRVPILWEM